MSNNWDALLDQLGKSKQRRLDGAAHGTDEDQADFRQVLLRQDLGDEVGFEGQTLLSP